MTTRFKSSMGACGATALLLSLALPPYAALAVAPATIATTPWPAEAAVASWRTDTGRVRAARIVSVSGDVTNAQALISGGVTVLRYSAGGTAPVVVLEYAREVGGVPYFDVTAHTGAPTIAATFSESRANAKSGDVTAGLTVAVDPARTSQFPVLRNGMLSHPVVQGGERYQVISLSTPGTVSLSGAGIRSLNDAHADTLAGANEGTFVSSSDALNQIWNAGAYTVELTRLDAKALPSAWRIGKTGVTLGATGTGIVQKSGHWPADYTMSFDVRVDRDSAGWVMRDMSNLSALRFVLHADTASKDIANTLEFSAFSTFAGGNKRVAVLQLPEAVAPGTWHSVRTDMRGPRLNVFVDGKPVGSLDADALGATSMLLAPVGSAGFFNEPGALATYRNLSITDATDKVLYSNPLTSADALKDFSADTNDVALLVDGAKRDRTVWSADLAVAAPTLFYTSNRVDAIEGSIRLLGSYRLANGEVSTTHSSQDPLIDAPADAYGMTGFYSTQYSMYFVKLLRDYYQYTGNLALVRAQWPALEGELRYLRDHADANGLISVDAHEAQDWLPDFAHPVTGVVTSTNAIYYGILNDAAYLAGALAKPDEQTEWQQQAARVRQSINKQLYNERAGFYAMSENQPQALAQDANALAVLNGVASPERARQVLANVATGLANENGRLAFSSDSGRPPVISPFATDAELRARLTTGDTTGALNLIQALWGKMIAPGEHYTGTTWEAMNANGEPVSPQTSLAHGWSSGPTSALSQYVLGIRPASPGYGHWLVKPQIGDLRWAQGSAPTPHGAIDVKWGIDAQGGIAMHVVVPQGTSGTIAVPLTRGGVRLNGETVATSAVSALDPDGVHSDGRAYAYINDVGPGTYDIEARN
ncbi:alpha-L-rhamnosidase C-terminal domain-containing protein [Paraburkholderia sp. J67]|uniref:alpha-L-rhamnosidase-related protein n=1 Tax=Paraburkholderia sp. J67 TaxID=2805435 RepID=UPI002ABDFA92|nr:alpha-L-rhamnosidase C-terminal domain-containing protein [Paraburkholderia sp. J67]